MVLKRRKIITQKRFIDSLDNQSCLANSRFHLQESHMGSSGFADASTWAAHDFRPRVVRKSL